MVPQAEPGMQRQSVRRRLHKPGALTHHKPVPQAGAEPAAQQAVERVAVERAAVRRLAAGL